MDGQMDAELRSALAKHMSDAEAATLFSCLKRHEIATGEALFEYGKTTNRLYFLRSGALTASLEVEGQTLALGQVPPGSWLGEVNLIDQGPASATVTAREDSVLFSLNHNDLLALRDAHPKVAIVLLQNITADLASRVRRTSAGLIERVNDQSFRVAAPAARQSWFGGALSWLFSGGAK